MTYELAKELKDAGFPQDAHFFFDEYGFVGCRRDREHGIPESVSLIIAAPSLSELIEACPTPKYEIFTIESRDGRWSAGYMNPDGGYWSGKYAEGSTPEIAVARLWLALNKKV